MPEDRDPEKTKWDTRYRGAEAGPPRPCRLLEEYQHLLPKSGKALEIACGLGGNALFLAAHGLDTSAWDLSEIAIEKLTAFAATQNLSITGSARDIVVEPPAAASFDVIVISHFLDRRLIPYLHTSLRDEGLIFYQTFTRTKIDQIGPNCPDYLLMDNELLALFHPMRILHYREEGRVGDLSRGIRNVAMLVAQKRS